MTGNIAFMFLCTILVFLMTPGLAFFYGGMVRRKNALNTMLFCFAMFGIGMVLWILVGYSLSFGEDHLSIIGDLKHLFLRDVSFEAGENGETPEILLAMFNMMFAVISPAIILGALAERMKFSKMMVFVIIWSFLVYYPLAHMAWGGGLLEMIDSIDFAGGNVIHISTGVSGLVACLFLGKRKGYGAMSYHPHNIPLFLLGAAILWAGWFGFNCGCAGAANKTALLAFCNTALSSATSMLVWMGIEILVQKKCTVMGAVTGGIVGLVGITPGAGYVPLWSALIIGATTAPICYLAISKVKKKFGYDDALDAFGCHGVGGIWGGIVTGIFATKEVNDAVPHEGLLYGDYRLFLAQIGAIAISIAVSVVMTSLILLVLKKCGGIRVSDMEEAQGLDLIEHGERAYPAFNGLD
ncbi:ammonium transporter [Ruminococcus sp.]|uniref:ammonium transporter n=1 Tax=Ruminococcus sp. TaxID=41978 RepID=UPI0025EB4A4A|nr:ammonium transporter [Ruminococcus sp.]